MTYQWYLQLKIMWSVPKVRYHILFMIFISVVSALLVIEKEFWSGVLIVFSAFSVLDITKLRYQIAWDYQHWLAAPESFSYRIMQLLATYVFDIKLMSFLLIAMLLLFNYQYSTLVLFLILYVCYILLTMVLFGLSRRIVWVSVLTKIIYVLPFGIAITLLISRFEEQAAFVLKWTADIRFITAIVCITISLLIWGLIQFKKKPFYKEEIVSNYNKNYWY